jgi:filamentous hemagglutinin family protein
MGDREMQEWGRSLFFITLPIASSIALLVPLTPANAQIIPDQTLGTQSSVVTPNVNINGNVSERIDGGAIRGANLFHSFQEFNVGNAGAVYFTTPSGIANILSRVTGTNPSNILGTLGVLGNANLFLINPNGIIFGSNARLDVRGSFVASTADSVVFDNGLEFSATNPQAPPLLTINIPIGLRYRMQQPGAIVNTGNLAVPAGENITLVGGSVATTRELRAPSGQINVAAVPSDSLVQLGLSGQVSSISSNTNPQATSPLPSNLPTLLNTIGADTDLRVTSDGQVELKGSGTRVSADVGTAIVSGTLDTSNSAPGQTGGTVQVLGHRVGLFDNAVINVSGQVGGGTALIGGNYQGQGSFNALATYVGRDVTINADATDTGNGGLIVLWSEDSTRAYGTLSARGGTVAGSGGLIETSSRNFLDVSGIQIDATAPTGLPGTWLIDPRNIIIQNAATTNGTFSGGNPNVFTPTGDDAVISVQDIQNQLNVGTNVTITTGSTGTQEGNITVANSITKTAGGAATLTLEAANNIIFNSGVEITSQSDALNMILTADSDRSGVGDFIATNAKIQANGGQISLSANAVRLEDGAGMQSLGSDNGNGGLININARSVLMKSSGIGTNTTGEGDAGQITINADTISLEQSGMGASTTGNGDGGQITIAARTLSFVESGVDTQSEGNGNAGQITINADTVSFAQSSGLSAKTLGGGGNGGQVTVNANAIAFTDGSGIGVETTTGTGSGGQIIFNAGTVSFEGGSGMNASTEGSADGGLIYVNADTFILKQSGFGSGTSGTGKGGQITIAANTVLVTEAGFGTFTEGSGDAGQINIIGKSVILNDAGVDTDSRGSGNSGQINITADSVVLKDAGLSSRAQSTGNGGEINVTANFLVVQGSKGNISSDSTGDGNGGNINLRVGELTVQDEGIVVVKSSGTGNAGTINVDASSINLDNQGSLRADTTGEQGNIILKSEALVMRRGSEITTNATGQDRVGGNITINTGVLVALENSDIAADSADFRGGNVNVTAQGIFGTQFRLVRTPDSDITARGRDSALSGTVIINTPGVDPSRGLVSLPETVVDPNALIAQNPCERGEGSAFVVTGRGGLPSNPSEILNSEGVRVDLVEPAPIKEREQGLRETPEQRSIKNPIVPANGWVFNDKGEVVLTAYNPNNAQPQRPSVNSGTCQTP